MSQKVSGHLYHKGDLTALLLPPSAGDLEAPSLFLRYALVVQGTERHVFPSLLLDDWGRERDTLGLYRWIFEQGQRFPRAEIFGFDQLGRKTQIFLRDLEIFFKYPCYLAALRQSPVSEHRRVHVVLFPDLDYNGQPQDIDVPDQITWPLRHGSLQWKQANPHSLEEFGWEPANFQEL